LKRGVKVAQYLPSYGDRPNDVMTVVKCEFSSESPMSSN
jgi:guanine nucleotide-binding protein subunit alpha